MAFKHYVCHVHTRAQTHYTLHHSSSLAFSSASSIFLSAYFSSSYIHLSSLPSHPCKTPFSTIFTPPGDQPPSLPPLCQSVCLSDTFESLFPSNCISISLCFSSHNTCRPSSSVVNLISCPLRLMRPAALCRVIDDTILSHCKAATEI